MPVALSGPTATVILLRYTVALHSVTLRFPGFGGVSQENRATPPEKGPVAPTFSALEGVSRFKLPLGTGVRYRGVSHLHCRLSRCNGPLSCSTIRTDVFTWWADVQCAPLLTGNGLRVRTERVKTSKNISEEKHLPRRFRRYPETL